MKRRLTLIAAALTLALVGTSMVFAYVNRADARAVAGLGPTKAYVTAKDVPAGTTFQQALDRSLVKQETFASKTVPADAVTHLTEPGRTLVTTADIPEGTLLLRSAFGAKAVQRDGLALPTGTMAVSVSLQDPQRVGDFVRPGSEIAIFDTYNTVVGFDANGNLASGNHESVAGDHLSSNHVHNHVTRVLLANVKVVAVGATTALTSASTDTTDTPAKTQSSSQAVLVTVAVKLHDAEKLVHGAQTGALYLALLPPDTSVTPDDGVDGTNLFH
jgi:pilus assembly protein CpaB